MIKHHKSPSVTWAWSDTESQNLGKLLYEEDLSEEDLVIQRLKYTKKELEIMHRQTLKDVITEELSHSIAAEIDSELLDAIRYGILKNAKTSTGTR